MTPKFMQNIICLEPFESKKEFTTFDFYNYLLPQLKSHYLKTKEPPVISFENLKRINPLVLPNILGLGYYLSRYHSEPIELKLTYEPKLLYYLCETNFFKICGSRINSSRGLDIFEFDERYLGGFGQIIENDQREEHKLHYYYPVNSEKNSYELDSHDEVLEDLLLILPNQFNTVLLDAVEDDEIDNVIESIAEPISNGMIHSESITWAIAQTTSGRNSKTVLSVADVGIGFEKSLQKNSIAPIILNESKKLNLYKSYLHDFFLIMESLYYSITKKRAGLIDLILNVADKKKGTVRIHYNSTQVLFTPRIINNNRKLIKYREDILGIYKYSQNEEIDYIGKEIILSEARKEIMGLSQFLLYLLRNDKNYSPIRLFQVKFKGVHVELEIPRSKI